MTTDTTSSSLTRPDRTSPADTAPTGAWDRTLAVLAGVVATADLLIQLIAGVIPPLLVLSVLALVGIGLLQRRPRTGRIWLLVVAVVGLLGGGLFALPALPHPESPADFIHALTSVPLRLLIVLVAVMAIRGLGGPVRMVRTGALATLGGLAALSLGIALLSTSSATIGPDDAVLAVDTLSFVDGDALTVAQGQRLVADNSSPIRHTFTITGQDVDVSLPPGQSTAVPLVLGPGTYDYLCTIPGHETMTGTLTVT